MGLDLKEKEVQELKDCLPVDGESFEWQYTREPNFGLKAGLRPGMTEDRMYKRGRKRKSEAFSIATKLGPVVITWGRITKNAAPYKLQVSLFTGMPGSNREYSDFNLWVPTANPALNNNDWHYVVLTYARHCFKHFVYITLFNLANNSTKQVLFLLPFHI